MSTENPSSEAEGEGEDSYAFSVRMTSQRMVTVIALVIIGLFAVVLEWENILDLAFGLFGIKP